MTRSIFAVLGGVVIVTILSFATAVASSMLLPDSFGNNAAALSMPVMLVMIVLSAAYYIAGCYFAASRMMDRPNRHALLTGAALLVWACGYEFYMLSYVVPTWFHIVRIIITLPCAFIAGKWYLSQHPYEPKGA